MITATRTCRTLLLAAMVCCLAPLLHGCSRQPQSEVWLIGLDAADWDLVGPMMDAGELPNLAALRDGGAHGILLSDEPMLSPVVWNSIATGKTPDQHGITWFMTDVPGGKVPVGTADRKVRALWNIASEAGLSCGVIGWWATWPAEDVGGFMVSDDVGWHGFGISGQDAHASGKTTPPDLIDTVERLLPGQQGIGPDLLAPLLHLPAQALDPAVPDTTAGQLMTNLRQAMSTTIGYTDLAVDQVRKQRPRLLAVYFEGTDTVVHLFGRYAPPRLPWITTEEFARYRDAVTAYWKWQDRQLGELLALRRPQTTVIVASDHGFRLEGERRREAQFSIETADADHMPDGLIIINGPGVKPGARLQNADVYDVAPTVLYALGLPPAADMSGRALAEAFTDQHVQAQPVTMVATYETSPLARPAAPERDREAIAARERMLRSLGYLNGPAPSTSKGDGRESLTVEQAVNMATVLMHQDKSAEAAALLRDQLAREPGHIELRLNLAQALARSGHPQEAWDLYAGLLEDAPQRLAVWEDAATLLELQARWSEAQALYIRGLDVHPDWASGRARLGRALLLTGRTQEAETTLRRVLQDDPRQPEACLYLGEVLQRQGDDEGALRLWTQAHELEPADPRVAVLLAGLHERRNEPQQALAALERTRELGGTGQDLLAVLGGLLIKTGRAAEAIPVLKEALVVAPDSPAAMGNLGMACAMQGDLPGAIDCFAKLVARDPQDAAAHDQLGSFYAGAGQLEEARRSLTRARELDPRNAGTCLRLGLVLQQAGQLAQAVEAYKAAVALDSGLAQAYYNLGVVENKLGHASKAQRYLETARQLDPALQTSPGSP